MACSWDPHLENLEEDNAKNNIELVYMDHNDTDLEPERVIVVYEALDGTAQSYVVPKVEDNPPRDAAERPLWNNIGRAVDNDQPVLHNILDNEIINYEEGGMEVEIEEAQGMILDDEQDERVVNRANLETEIEKLKRQKEELLAQLLQFHDENMEM